MLQLLCKKNLLHRFVQVTHGFSNVSIRQVTPIVATLAMGLLAAIRREVARVDQQDPDR